MHRVFQRGVLKGIILLIGIAMMMNTFVIMAQELPPPPPPTDIPTDVPTDIPTEVPTEVPTELPTDVPTDVPTEVPTEVVTEVPTEATEVPTDVPTETAVAGLPAEPDLSLLVRELFDNGDLSPWSLSAGWSLTANEGGLALQVVNSNEALRSLKGQFFNVAVQTRFLISSGAAQISIRQSAAGDYTASLDASGLVTLSRAGQPIGSAVVAPMDLAGWHYLRLSAMNDVVRVAVDNLEVIALSDTSPLPPGEVSLSAKFAADSTAVPSLSADDFFLWVPTAEVTNYPQPTVIAPPVIPTELPPTVAPPTVVPPVEVTPLAPGKATSQVPPPSEAQLAGAEASGNDNLANSVTITGAYPTNADNGDTTTATLELNETLPSGCGVNVGKTVWFTFTPNAAATYTISLAGSSFDTVLGIYTGSAVNSLTQVACNDDASATVLTSQVNLVVAAGSVGTPYKIQIGGYQQAFGTYNITITKVGAPAAAAPVLTTPAAGAVTADTTPTFNWTINAANVSASEFQLSTVSTFATLVGSAQIIAAPTVTYTPSALADGVYYWRVRGINANGIPGAFSASRMITIKTVAPNLTTPAVNAVVTTVRPSFTWAAYGTGAKYLLELSDDNFSTAADFAYPNLTVVTKAIPAPDALHQGDWYWRVTATDSANNTTAASPGRKFTVNLLKTPLAGANVISATTANVAFSWFAATGATGYRVDLDTDGDHNFATGTLQTCQPATATGLTCTINALAAGSYDWRVVALPYDETPLPASHPVRSFTVTPAVPAAPVLNTPAAAAVTALDTVTLNWKPSATGAATQYEVQVGNAAFTTIAFTNIVDAAVACTGSPVTCTATTAVLADGTYSWRVRGINSVGAAGAFSAARTFTVKTTGPALTAPADGATVTDSTPAFSWAAYTGATGYTIEIADNPGFTGAISANTTLPSYTPAANAPLMQGTWYWHVLAKDKNGVSTAFGPSRSFNLAIQTAPLNDANTTDTTPTFTWVAIPGVPALRYRVEIATASTFGGTIVQTSPDLSAATYTANILSNGTYFWRVKVAVDGVSFQPANPPYRVLHIGPAAPAAPVLTSPATAAILWTQTPTLSWNKSATTTATPYTYQVQVGSNATFTSIAYSNTVADSTCLPGCSTTTSTLANGLYYWRVRAVNSFGVVGAYSAARTFTVANAVAPNLTAPADNSNTTVNMPSFTWTKPAGAVKFEINLDTDTPPTIIPSGGSNLTVTSFKPAGPLLATTYYWRVRAFDVLGNASPYSVIRSVKIVTPTTGSPLPNRFAPDNPSGYQLPKVSWGPISWTSGGGWYEVIIDDASNFLTPVFSTPHNATVLPSGTQSIQEGVGGFPVLPNGIYYWKVRACYSSGSCGAYSTVGSFAVDR